MDLDPMVLSKENLLTAYPCDFKQYINPVQIRRMSRVLKMGFAAALKCLQEKSEIVPDAIAIGTGKGSLSDTEQFLSDIKQYQETALNSIPFIQSTYNQLSGMIALNRKIDSYNITYVHRAFSLESAMMDTAMYLMEIGGGNALVGSYDEITVEHFKVKKQWGYWKKDIVSNDDVLGSKTTGTLAGEGAGFMLVSTIKPPQQAVLIQGVKMLYKPSTTTLSERLHAFLHEHELSPNDINLLVSGWNGDQFVAEANECINQQLPLADIAYFKHLSGEYDTAIHFGIHLTQHIMQQQRIPNYCKPVLRNGNKAYKYALLYNNFFQINQCFWLLKFEE